MDKNQKKKILLILLVFLLLIILTQNFLFSYISSLILCCILFITNIANKDSSNGNTDNNCYSEYHYSPSEQPTYFPKNFMTNAEKQFYNTISSLNQQYIIIPQVNLATIVTKKTTKNSTHRTELFRNIDFGIFDKNFNLLLLIELNDSTHNSFKRKDRDLKVKRILNECNIKLLTFYTKYPNESNYVINRIIQTINGN